VNKTHALAQLVHQDLQTHQGHQLSHADAGNTSTQTPCRAQGLVVPLERNSDSRLEGGVNRAKLKFTNINTTTSWVSVRNKIESAREGAKQISSK
jgi:hypothetical protein